MPIQTEEQYLRIFLQPVRECMNYKPKFGGKGKGGKSLDEFLQLYAADAFYHWVGLDSPLMYAAHKAAGSMTSIYRQIGRGGEALFGRLLLDRLGLSKEQAGWSYELKKVRGKSRRLTLDGRIDLADISERAARDRISKWLRDASAFLGLSSHAQTTLRGAVFEVRQGYKSADAKRQNADLANASRANAERYLPVVFLLSDQISQTVAERYEAAKMLLLRGRIDGPATASCYTFSREVLNFDLAKFFQTNSGSIRSEVETVLKHLLSPA